MVLQWIPSHCGVSGNEKADKLAKQGAKDEQPDKPVTYSEKRTMIKYSRKRQKQKDDYHLLDREQQVIIFRLRTGHSRLKSHMHRRFKIGDSPTCPCGNARQDTEHILQHCRNHEDMRLKWWPTVTPMDRKLYGTREELIKTTNFILESKVIV